jgi:hypothetical protein
MGGIMLDLVPGYDSCDAKMVPFTLGGLWFVEWNE